MVPLTYLSKVMISVMWSLHELAKEADWVAEIGSSNGEVD